MTEESKCSTCKNGECSAGEKKPNETESEFLERRTIAARTCQIRNKLVVLSGKGGVGKSTVAVNLAAFLAAAGKRVGLLDVDVHGPSVPKLLHIEDVPVTGNGTALDPVVAFRMKVMSLGLLLRGRDEAVIWRGPMKSNLIKQFLRDVEWGKLDFLVVDCPPGTGDEPMTIIQLLERSCGAVVVTTPQELAIQDVRRSIMFCREMNLPVSGVIENMSGFLCPGCGAHTDIFGSGRGRAMAQELGVPFLGAIPIDPRVVESGDNGKPITQVCPGSETSKAFSRIAGFLLEHDRGKEFTAG